MTITLTRQEVDNIADCLNIENDSIYFNYSGRGMYGRECLGFTFSGLTDVWARLLHIEQPLKSDLIKWYGWDEDRSVEVINTLLNVSTDSMAYDTILYFPNVQTEPE